MHFLSVFLRWLKLMCPVSFLMSLEQYCNDLEGAASPENVALVANGCFSTVNVVPFISGESTHLQ